MNINADELVSFPKQIKIVLKLRALLTHTIQLLFNHTVHESCLINISPLHSLGAKWVHFLTLTSCALDPRALTSSLKQPNCAQKPREPSLKPPCIKPFNDSPR